MIAPVVVWYLVVQVVGLAVLPLAVRLLPALPDRGYSLSKILGILLVAVVLWLAVSYGVLRNERGGAWLALVGVAGGSWLLGWRQVRRFAAEVRQLGNWRHLLVGELIFAWAFFVWALVRAYDPAANHTEQPMDLMFMNSIWASATYPPQDAWLAGYAISYYYLGYWLLTTLGRLANIPPQIAYNVGQACWYGLLWLGCYGVVTNLLAYRFDRTPHEVATGWPRYAVRAASMAGGLLAAVAVALVGNLMVVFEWLYAQGVNVTGIARWLDVNNFPPLAPPTGAWYISNEWWWWRSSRVIKDITLAGNYTDVIDEFPMFSYLLGDNHPHVMAMPVVLLVIALAFNLLLVLDRTADQPAVSDDVLAGAGRLARVRAWVDRLPLGWPGVLLYIACAGSLIFLNTWDFPPYWALLVAVVLVSGQAGQMWAWRPALLWALGLLGGAILLYLPYFLSAQSQADGVTPNLFNPTRLAQFLVMFGAFIPALVGLLIWGWRVVRPRRSTVAVVGALVLGVPIGFLLVSGWLATSTPAGQAELSALGAPTGYPSYGALIWARWLRQPWTLLFCGVGVALFLTILLTWAERRAKGEALPLDLLFVLALATLGLGLVYAPEFVYLRDFFGTRMNTVFKFYYQGWLLFGLATAYFVAVMLRQAWARYGITQALALASLLLLGGGLLFPLASVYGKTGGFASTQPTLDATAYIEQNSPDVMAAVLWVRDNTTPGTRILEGKGGSYNAGHNRISALTGRPTLLGWEGHELQWRGDGYGEMVRGRPEALDIIYRNGTPEQIAVTLETWDIDYVFVGPSEIEQYGITDATLARLAAAMELVFERGQVRIYRR